MKFNLSTSTLLLLAVSRTAWSAPVPETQDLALIDSDGTFVMLNTSPSDRRDTLTTRDNDQIIKRYLLGYLYNGLTLTFKGSDWILKVNSIVLDYYPTLPTLPVTQNGLIDMAGTIIAAFTQTVQNGGSWPVDIGGGFPDYQLSVYIYPYAIQAGYTLNAIPITVLGGLIQAALSTAQGQIYDAHPDNSVDMIIGDQYGNALYAFYIGN